MRFRLGTAVLLTCSLAAAALSFTPPASAADQPGVASAEVAQILANDDTARQDDHGFLYYVDPAPTPPDGLAQPMQPRRSQSFTTSQAGLSIPVLNSRPGSTHTVYLDFNGVTLPATSGWANPPQGQAGIAAGTYTGFTLDGSADFTQSEIDFIDKTWRIVAEKYAAFDVNVTTVDPGQAALTRTDSTDHAYGVQVVITDDPSPLSQICNSQCAGIAYNDLYDGWYLGNLYNTANYSIAWVFSSQTYGSAQMTALDASHEVGHTLGLNHDGGSANPNYYEGHANWVPIMGITNQNAVSQFSKGEYSGANNSQDDLAVIALNGDSHTAGSLLNADDFTTSAGTPVGAADLSGQTSYALDGVISNAADDDLFAISRTCTGPLTVAAAGIGSGQALDIKLDLLDATGTTVLDTDDPASGQDTSQPGDIGFLPTGLDATTSVGSMDAGTVFRVRVDGVGSGNPLNTGYSDYASIGQYHLAVSDCTGAIPAVPGAPATASTTPDVRATTGTISWTAPSDTGGSAITNYKITGLPGGTVEVGDVLTYDATALNPGTTYYLTIAAKNATGYGATRSTSIRVATWAPTAKPTLAVTLSGTTATLSYVAPANPGKATLTGWFVDRTGPGSAPADKTVYSTSTTMAGLVAGAHSFTVRPIYSANDPTPALASDPKPLTVITKPSSPRIGVAVSGKAGGTKNATAKWAAPLSNGGATITGYRVIAYKIVGGKIVRTYVSKVRLGSARSFVFALPGGSYKFRVIAYNKVGASPRSGYSKVVSAR